MSDVTEYMVPCMNKAFFGVDCPGCGIQRSAVMVVQGDKERFIPYIQDSFVKNIDLESGKIVVDWDPDF